MSQVAPPYDAASAAPRRSGFHVVRDYIALTKPSINRMCLLTTAGGLALAPLAVDLLTAMWALLGTALAVGSANALNMWWERGTDPLMKRTRDRPLAAGRISERGALVFGLLVGVAGLVVLGAGTNTATFLIGAGALASYVLVYTPLKYKTPLALVIGAIPGAAPPLMGWTAATGGVDAAGLALFGTLLVWQMPHFIAITIFRKHDYGNAGIRTVAVVRGNTAAKWQAIAWSVALVAVSATLTPLGVTGGLYLAIALVLGAVFTAYGVAGLFTASDARWSYRYFLLSLIYLPLLVGALVLDVAIA